MAVTRSTTELVAFNAANPGADADVFSSALAIKGKCPTLRVAVVPATSSVVNLTHTDGTTTFTYALDAGGTVTADQVKAWDVPAVSGHSYNVQFATSQTGHSGKIPLVLLQVVEV